MLYTLLVIFLILAIVGGLPHWGYAQHWNLGYYPSGISTIVLIVVLFLLLR